MFDHDQVERFTYAAIVNAEDFTKWLTQDPVAISTHIANAERSLEELENRRGTVRVLYQDDFGGLFDLLVHWTQPQQELTISWYAIPEGTQVATARIPVFRTANGWRGDMTFLSMAIRWVKQWTRPGWFRCHVCARRTRRDDPDTKTTITGIFCGPCWTKYGDKIAHNNLKGSITC